MRTSIDIPDDLFRHLKTRAALEGTTLRELVLGLIARGLSSPAVPAAAPVALPSISLGAPMALGAAELSNASLGAYLDE